MTSLATRPAGIDQGGMLEHAAGLGREFLRAWISTGHLRLRLPRAPRGLVLVGLGGSATAGDYVARLAAGEATAPVASVRGDALPGWAGPGVVVVAISYSGETAETVAAARAAAARGCHLVVVAAGGELLALARSMDADVVEVGYASPPRAALGHLLAGTLRVAEAAGVVSLKGSDVHEAALSHAALCAPWQATAGGQGNSAKELAAWMLGGIPIIVGAEHLAPLGVRFKNQMAENGKWPASTEELPEMAHNTIAALTPESASWCRVVFLESAGYTQGIADQFRRVQTLVESAGIGSRSISFAGRSRLEDMLLATAWADFASCYAAIGRGMDPTPVPQIDRLKAAVTG